MSEANNPFAPLGLPATWVPAPMAWRLGNVEMTTPAGVVKVHVLVIDTPLGRLGFAFDDTAMRALGEAIVAQASGLTLARALPNTNGGRT